MRILIRTSRTAIWARRLGSVAVPLVVLSVLLHRFGSITSDVFLIAIIGAGIVAELAVLVALLALWRLWWSGDRGWGLAVGGLALGLLCLAPFGWYGSLAMRFPAVTDIATTDRSNLPLLFEPGMAAMPAPKRLSTAELATVFPNVATRRYPLGVPQTFAVVQGLVAEREWDVRLLHEPGPDNVGRINAQIMTLPGWREAVVLRVSGSDSASQVDMRSASLNAQHDFGSNGLRIESFLTALDEAITVLLRDNPNANQPLEEDDAAVEPVAVD
ncbi:MAG TPA: DUF1499 domain-containing protein [Devosia sp.]|nr:DUF1499 domain-containing protein [Devosia sp.]